MFWCYYFKSCTILFCYVSRIRYYFNIVSKKINNFFSRIVKLIKIIDHFFLFGVVANRATQDKHTTYTSTHLNNYLGLLILNLGPLVILLTLNKSKKRTPKLPREKPDAYALLFFRPTPFSVISHSPVDYHQAFRPILYFQPSPLQSDSRLYPTPI